MNNILEGFKTYEYKESNDFWDKRLEKFKGRNLTNVGINFLCGRQSYKFRVLSVWCYHEPIEVFIGGKKRLMYWCIRLGEQIFEKDKERCNDVV